MALPNYEAIAVTVILQCVKLIFRLDDVTEFCLSDLVREMVKHGESRSKFAEETKTFDFKEWFQLAGWSLYLLYNITTKISLRKKSSLFEC